MTNAKAEKIPGIFRSDMALWIGGGDGGNAGGFVEAGSLYYVHRVTDEFRLGITAGT